MVERHTLARWRFEDGTGDWHDDAAKYEAYHWSDDKETLEWWGFEHSELA